MNQIVFQIPNNAANAIEMVEVTGGMIDLRDDRLKKQWTVKVDAFLLAKFPVTQSLYQAVTQESPSAFKGANRPVENVSWTEAILFCNLLSGLFGFDPCYSWRENEKVVYNKNAGGFRLPTEAEWEYACKAGTKSPRYGEMDDIAWYKNNSGGETKEIGIKSPNPWDFHDMLGNVWEWCSDLYDETIYGSYRIFRGGGWNDNARGCLATNRRRSHPTSFKIDDLGFRIAKNKEKE